MTLLKILIWVWEMCVPKMVLCILLGKCVFSLEGNLVAVYWLIGTYTWVGFSLKHYNSSMTLRQTLLLIAYWCSTLQKCCIAASKVATEQHIFMSYKNQFIVGSSEKGNRTLYKTKIFFKIVYFLTDVCVQKYTFVHQNIFVVNGTMRIRHQCRKTNFLCCHSCLINTGVEKMNKLLI